MCSRPPVPPTLRVLSVLTLLIASTAGIARAAPGLEVVWNSAEADATAGVAWGDYDADGDLDFAAGNNGANRVYRNVDGSFELAWSSAETDWTLDVAWADYDRDGDLDLAVGNHLAPNRVYRNDAGSFVLAWSSSELDDTWSVAWADWDGDGDLDLAAGNWGQPIRLYRNNAGSFALAWSAPVANSTASVAWGDWDGDGDPDLAVGNYNQVNAAYRNDGGWLVLAWIATEAYQTRSMAWGDWNGDGALDLAVGNHGQPNVLLHNDYGLLVPIWTSAESDVTWSVAWGDWDGDGDLDLAAGNDGTSRVYRNDGGFLNVSWNSPSTASTFSVAWGDRDGDGDLDLLAGNRGAANRVFENDADVSMTLAWTFPEEEYTRDVAWGDVNGDGYLDLAFANIRRSNRIYVNSGGPLSLWWESAEWDDSESLAWGDWDDDGDLDLAVGNRDWFNSTQRNRVYRNDSGVLNLAWTSSEAEETYSVAWGDWDSDGDLDLAVGNRQHPQIPAYPNTRLYRNVGGALSSAWTSPSSRETVSMAWGDHDGDGDFDLAEGNSGTQDLVYRNILQGQLVAGSFGAADGSTTSVAWADWDGDGDLDVAVGSNGNPLRIYRNELGSFGLAWSDGATYNTHSVAWADWDGDGDLDLATGNDGSPNRLYRNVGGAFEAAWSSAELDSTRAIAWGDWDADGDLDLAIGNGGWEQQNRLYRNGLVNYPGRLPESPVLPVATRRPGITDSAFFVSSAERLSSPVMIPYTLIDEQSDPAPRIIVEYSLAGGGQWLPASAGPGGDGTTNLPASPAGTAHTFSWDAEADHACSEQVVFRITVPWQAPVRVGGPIQRAGVSATTPPFRLGCPSWYLDLDGDGLGDPEATRQAWNLEPDLVANGDDCDDGNGDVYPGAPEIYCDGLNNDCDDPNWPTPHLEDQNLDGDDFLVCEGDCDDSDAHTYPGAHEYNDGEDNQCPGDDGYGLVDEIEGVCGFLNPLDKNEFSWPPQVGVEQPGNGYRLVRSTSPLFTANCMSAWPWNATSWSDNEPIPQGWCYYYLVQAWAPYRGSFGRDSSGDERTDICP